MKQLFSICCVAVFMLLAGSVLATDITKSASENVAQTGKSVSDFLTPDGQFDLNAVRSSGYQGPLDLKGVDVRVDPKSGAPMVSSPSPQLPADDPDDIYWDNSISSSLQGIGGYADVNAAAIYEGKLIIGGRFTMPGDTIANNIVAWDGRGWSPLGSGMDYAVRTLMVYNGNLIAGGHFTTAGGTSANSIASWNGTTWSPLGLGVDNAVISLTVYDGNLIAGGNFTTAGGTSASHIASWNGSTWSPLGLGINGCVNGAWPPVWKIDGCVNALTVYNGKLVVGGWFDSAGGTSANSIASWDGSTWSPLGSGVNGGILAFTIYDDKLVAGGSFSVAGTDSVNNIACWDGSGWLALGEGVGGEATSPLGGPRTSVRACALTVHDNKLVVGWVECWMGERYPQADGLISCWDGSNWSVVGAYFCSWGGIGSIEGDIGFVTTYGNRLIVGGYFSTANEVPAAGIASWDGSNWSPLVPYGQVDALTAYNGKLIAGGNFNFAADYGVAVNNIASWNGARWSALGTGIVGSVHALTEYDGKLIAGGTFDSAGGVAANNIAAWDGANWSTAGSGVNGDVRALTVYDGRLIAGGRFTAAGGVAANLIASWDGSNWSALGAIISNVEEFQHILALTVYDGKLIAGGDFTTFEVGGSCAIAAWDGTTWSSLGPGICYQEDPGMVGSVYALTVQNDKLIASGSFVVQGTTGGTHVASWDGSEWSSLAQPTAVGCLTALTVYDGKLIAGGNFTAAGGTPADNIASWDGNNWLPLGSGLSSVGYNTLVHTLTVYDDMLIVSGNFTHAGGKVSPYLAVWTKHDPTDVEEGQTTTLPKTFSLVQNYPNPFNPATSIEYSVPTRSHVTLEIFNLLGQRVKTLVDETKSAGNYKTQWDGTDATGKTVSTGVYLYRFKAGDFVETKKMVLLK